MAPITDIEHPAIVRFMPRRGRVVRIAVARVVTPVRLVEIGRSEMPEAGRTGDYAYHEHDGRIWMPVGPFAQDVEGLRRHADLEMRNPMNVANRHGWIHTLLGRSPLAGFYPQELGFPEELPAGTPVTILRDNSERAASALTSYLDGDVRIVDGAPFVALRGPLVMRTAASGDAPRISVSAWARAQAGEVTVPSRIDAAREVWGRRLEAPLLVPPNDTLADDVPPEAMPERECDLLHFLNTAAATTLTYSRVVRSTEVYEAMAPWAELGMIGAVRREEADDVAAAVLAACEAGAAKHESLGISRPAALDNLADFVRGYVRPMLERAPDVEDVEAMGGMSP